MQYHAVSSKCRVIDKPIHAIPVKEQTAAYRLFFHYRPVQVQQIFTMNTATMEQVGAPTSGNPEIDKDLRTEWVSVSYTAPELVALLKRGGAFMFTDVPAATKLYLDLVEHLRNWQHAFETNGTLRRAPLPDLQAFDELAGETFKYVSHSLINDEDITGYGSWLAQMSRFRRGITQNVLAGPMEHGGVPTYRSISDQIAAQLDHRTARR